MARSGEFERISKFFAPLTEGFPGAFGLTDDAAVIAPMEGRDIVVTTDTAVAGVHFPCDESPGLIAAKLLRVNLSDLAAMGASPLAYTLNVALPAEVDDDWLGAFAQGLRNNQEAFSLTLAGGDSVSTPGPLTLTITAFGTVAANGALRRSGAQLDDVIYVSGTIGDAALGLKLLRGELNGIDDVQRDELVGRYRLPRPRIGLGSRLLGLATAAVDVSDGLAADLEHVLSASGAGAEIEAGMVPLSQGASALLSADGGLIETVLTGGDDYEILFTVAPGYAGRIAALASDLDLQLTAIGRIVEGPGLYVRGLDGRELMLPRKGWQHGG